MIKLRVFKFLLTKRILGEDSVGKFLESFDKKLKAVDKSNYYREQYQTFMTGPEWRDVEMADEIAKFLKDGKSLFQFPYFSQIYDLWRVIYNSYSAARKYNSALQIIKSDYMAMDLFIGFFTTVEYVGKGLISLIFKPFLSKENKTEMQDKIATLYFERYAKDIQTLPFYDHKYDEIKNNLSKEYDRLKSANKLTTVDKLSWFFVSLELSARYWISKPCAWWFHSDSNIVAPTTDLLVKLDIDKNADFDLEKNKFLSNITKIATKNKDPEDKQKCIIVEDTVFVKNPSNNKSYTSLYAQLRAPRYGIFQNVLEDLKQAGFKLKKIAGQTRVQVKCQIDAQNELELNDKQAALNDKMRQSPIYSYGDRIHPFKRICFFDMHVRDIAERVNDVKGMKDKGVDVKFIHNF